MTPKLTERLSRLEAEATPPTNGKYLMFQLEAPLDTSQEDIVAFLRERGHCFRDEDTVLLTRLGTGPLRDLSPEIVTQEIGAAASPAMPWPKSAPTSSTFTPDSPRGTCGPAQPAGIPLPDLKPASMSQRRAARHISLQLDLFGTT